MRGPRQGAAGDLSSRLEQLEDQQRRQLEMMAALQRDLGALTEVSRRAVTRDVSPVRGTAEVVGDAAQHDAAQHDAAEHDAELVPTIEQSRAASEAESIVQRATVAGRWTDQDSHRLDDQLRQMVPEDAEELRREVIAALNRGELEIAFSGRPAF